MTTIAFVHHKGGTGKTTSCINIAGWLVKLGKNVLVVDLDPQGNATSGLGIDRNTIEASVYDVLFPCLPAGRNGKKLQEVILETPSGVHLAPSSLDLLAAETHMAGLPDQTTLLKKKLADIQPFFDFILIDVPPGSTMLMINGIVAAGNIIIPLDSGVFAYETLETLQTLLQHIHDELGLAVNVMFVILREHPILTFYLFEPVPTKEIKKLLKEYFTSHCGECPGIFKAPYSKKIYESQKRGVPISYYAPWSSIGRFYKKLAKEVESYGNTD